MRIVCKFHLLTIDKIVNRLSGVITNLNLNDKTVISYILSTDQQITINRIALDTGLSEATVNRSVKSLKACQLIETTTERINGRQVTEYHTNSLPVNNFKYYDLSGNELFINKD